MSIVAEGVVHVVVGLAPTIRQQIRTARRLIFKEIYGSLSGQVTKTEAVRVLVERGLSSIEQGLQRNEPVSEICKQRRGLRVKPRGQEWFGCRFERAIYDRLEAVRIRCAQAFLVAIPINGVIRYAIAQGLAGLGLCTIDIPRLPKSKRGRPTNARLIRLYETALLKLPAKQLHEFGLSSLARRATS